MAWNRTLTAVLFAFLTFGGGADAWRRRRRRGPSCYARKFRVTLFLILPVLICDFFHHLFFFFFSKIPSPLLQQGLVMSLARAVCHEGQHGSDHKGIRPDTLQ